MKINRKRRFRPLRFALAAAASIVSLAAVILILVRIGAFDRLILSEASRRLEAATGLTFEAEKIDVDPFRLSLRLRKPAVHAVEGRRSALRRFTADAIVLDVPWSLVFGGRLRFEKVRIVRPEAILAPPQGPSGARPDAPSAPPAEPAHFDLRIDDFELDDGRAGWQGLPGSFGVSLEGIVLRVGYDPVQRNHLASIAAAGGHLRFGDKDLGLERLALKGRFGPGDILVDTFEAATRDSSLSLAGTVKDYASAPEFDGRASLRLSVGDLPLPVRFAAGAEGLLAAEVKVSGKAGALAYEADVSTSGLRTRELGAARLAGRIRGDLGTVTVTELDVRTELGAVEGTLTADLKGKALPAFDIEWKDLDLDRIPPIRRILEGLPVSMGSLASGRLSGKAESFTLDGIEGSLALALVSRPEGEVSGEIRLRASGGEFVLDKARLSGAGISLETSGSVRRDGRLAGRYALKIESVPAAFGALLRAGLIAHGPGGLGTGPEDMAGSISIGGTLAGRLDAPAFTADVDIPELRLGTLLVESLNAGLQGDSTKISVRSLEGKIAGGTMRGSGTLSLNAVRAPGEERLSLGLEGVSLAQFATLLPEPWKSGTEGLFTAGAEVTTGPGGVSAVFSAEAKGLVLAGFAPRLSLLKIDGAYGTSRFELKEFVAETETGTISGRGGVDLGSREFSATLFSSGIDLDILGPLVPPGFGLGGRAAVDIDAEGTLDAPRGTLSLSVADLRAGPLAVPSVELLARSDGTSAEASLRLPGFDAGFEGKLSLSSPYTLEGKITAKNLPLDRLLGSKPSGVSPNGALLDLDAVIIYPLADPSGFSASAAFSGKDFSIGPAEDPSGPEPSAPLTSSVAGRVRASGDPAATASFEVEGELSRLLLDLGGTSLSNPEPVRFRFADGIFRLDALSLAGTAGSLTASGTAGPFAGSPEIAGRVRSDFDLAVLSPFVSGMLIGGRLKADLDVRGGLSGPAVSGRAVLAEGFVRSGDFPLTVNGISAEISFDGSRLEVARLEGMANGGTLRIQGGLDGLLSGAPPSGRLTVDARNFQLEYPPGLHTTSDIALALTGGGGEWTLGGTMKVLRGLFREDISAGGYILGFGTYRLAGGGESELPGFIRAVRLDIAVSTPEPIVVKNNLADLEILADVRVSGNPGLPLFSGRLRNDTVGAITFGDRRFSLETMQLDLLGQAVPDPNIEIVAYTNITHNSEPLDIRLQLSGRASELEYSLTSTPPRSEEDLSLIILTGKSLEEVRGSAVNTLTTQALRFFSSPIASPVTGTLERLLKIEEVSFVPLLDSSETDPGARFTFRKSISEKVDVTYSIDISSTQDQTWILDYRLKRDFSLQAFGKDDGSYGASFRHSLPIRLRSASGAGAGQARAEARPILSKLTVEGDPKLPPGKVDKALRRVREGKPFSYSRLSAAVAKLIKTYKKTGFPNADIRPTVTASEDGKTTDVHLLFLPGSPGELVFGGDGLPSRTRKSVRNGWTGMFPEDANLGQAQSLILKSLHKKGYHDARVEAERREGEDGTIYLFTVTKGVRYEVRGFDVKGNPALPAEKIIKALPRSPYKGLWSLVYDPRSALNAIAGAYREIGYPEARVRRSKVVSDPSARALDIGITVTEGPRRMVRSVAFEDNAAIAEAELRGVVQTAKDKPYDPALLLKDKDALLAFCRSRGFRKAEITAEASPRAGEPDVDIVFKVREGEVHTVSGLEVTGTERTRESLVLKTARIKQGDVFSFGSLALGQKRLYDLGVFRAVNISTPESAKESTDVPVVLDVQEENPLTFTYGLRYNSEDKLEGQVGLTAVNLLGRGRTGYAGYRQGTKLWDVLLSVNVPYVFGYRADTRFSLSANRESREAYVSEEIGASVGQEIDFKEDVELSVFYKLSRVRDKEPDAAAYGPSNILSEVSLNFVRDTRNNRFDARSGTFLSLSVTAAPDFFGSKLPYAKIFTQYSFYRKAWRGVYWASNVRFGAMTKVEEDFPANRLFYAGGGTSLRGFEQDRVGPIDPSSGLPTGGRFVLLLNEELRIPLVPLFSGVVFYDVGNVYASFSDMGHFDLRQGIGAGLRFQSPVGLIRFDCGFNPFRRADEPATVLFLSIGQAF